MSHGTEGKVYAKDMSYPVERLWNPFLGDNCKTLKNKPKIFFIQACRGENLEKAVEYSSFAVMTRELAPAAPAVVQPITYAIPSTADMLVFYSTFDSEFSWEFHKKNLFKCFPFLLRIFLLPQRGRRFLVHSEPVPGAGHCRRERCLSHGRRRAAQPADRC